MLLYVVHRLKDSTITRKAVRLQLHADNCSGQNKNRFVLFFLLLLTMSEFYDSLEIFFIVAGHKKNECDSSFGHVKRLFRMSDVLNPCDMIDVIEKLLCLQNEFRVAISIGSSVKKYFHPILKYHIRSRLLVTILVLLGRNRRELYLPDGCIILKNTPLDY